MEKNRLERVTPTMTRYWIKLKVPRHAVDSLRLALEDNAECVNVFEDETSPPDEEPDENGFPVASVFNFDLLCQDREVEFCLKLVEAATAILGIDAKPSPEPVKDADWSANYYRAQAPIRVTPYVIRGSGDDSEIPAGAIDLRIDAATAFGSGDHPTTRGCLETFAELAKKREFFDVCDMGCGSGVLSIAAKKSRARIRVVAADIEPEAVKRTKENVRLNRCESEFAVVLSKGFQNPATRKKHDLCFANILAKPLARLSAGFREYIAKGGFVIASGLLVKQESMVANAFIVNGFKLDRVRRIEGWSTLLLERI